MPVGSRENPTNNRDHEYGAYGNEQYDAFKDEVLKSLSEAPADKVAELCKKAVNYAKKSSRNGDVTAAYQEAAEDAFHEQGLPSPFSNKTVQRLTTTRDHNRD
jgi:hypothetical protein